MVLGGHSIILRFFLRLGVTILVEKAGWFAGEHGESLDACVPNMQNIRVRVLSPQFFQWCYYLDMLYLITWGQK